MKIATWNVNSIKAHLDAVVTWLKDAKPDVLCLQEIKCEDHNFPRERIEELGYNCAIFGQKTYNGVAILSRLPMDNVLKSLPGRDDDDQSRYIQASVAFGERAVTIGCLYLPNGNPAPGPKFDYKLEWMQRLKSYMQSFVIAEEMAVFCGDYNIIPANVDARFPERWKDDALFLPQSRRAFSEMTTMGLTECFRALHPLDTGSYSFWDYQAGAWQKNNGIRIDHALLTPQAMDRAVGAAIDKSVRGWEKPSDHVPLIIELA